LHTAHSKYSNRTSSFSERYVIVGYLHWVWLLWFLLLLWFPLAPAGRRRRPQAELPRLGRPAAAAE
jgi:hypothetical protein